MRDQTFFVINDKGCHSLSLVTEYGSFSSSSTFYNHIEKGYFNALAHHL